MLALLEVLKLKDILTCSTTILAVIDIVGSLPVILSIRQQNQGDLPSGKVTLTAIGIMLLFLLLGQTLLTFLDLDINSFGLAGAFLLFLVGLEMITGRVIFKNSLPDVAVYVPLAFPIIAGPGSMTVLISLKSEYHVMNILIALVINMIWVYVVLKNAVYIEKILQQKGIAILRKVFGIILIAIAIKLIKSNILA